MSSRGFHYLRATWLICNEFKAQVCLTPRPYIKMVLFVETAFAFFPIPAKLDDLV